MGVGIDIGSKAVKVVELAKSGNGFSLRGAGAVGYQGTSIDQNSTDADLAIVGNTIKKLCHDVRIHGKDVAISLPESQVFTRILKFPLLNDEEIANAVKYEVEDYIPIPLAEAVVEHTIIERVEKGTPPRVLVLLTATTRALVEKYIKAVSMADMNVTSVETSLLAAVRSVAPLDKNSVVVETGSRATEIAIAKSGQIYFTRSIPTAGEAFTRAIAQSFNIAASQAEQYKQTYGFDPSQMDGKVKMAMQPILSIITEEIKKTIHFYQMETKGESPNALMIAGATASIPYILNAITDAINITVTLANPFSRVQMDEGTAKNMMSYAHLYTVATGLAMR